MCLVSKESEFVLDLTDRTELSSGKNRKERKRKERHLGGYSVGDPPLSIPNREVKPNGADGTACRKAVSLFLYLHRHIFPFPEGILGCLPGNNTGESVYFSCFFCIFAGYCTKIIVYESVRTE